MLQGNDTPLQGNTIQLQGTTPTLQGGTPLSVQSSASTPPQTVAPPPTKATKSTTQKMSTSLTDIAQSGPFKFMDGSGFDATGNYQPAQINQNLNTVQQQAFDTVSNQPKTSPAEIKNSASDAFANLGLLGAGMLSNSLSQQDPMMGTLLGSTTGENSVTSRVKNMYSQYGFDDLQNIPQYRDDYAKAQEDYKMIQAQRQQNIFSVEQSLQGGGTKEAANILNERQQHDLAVKELAAATRMQAAQTKLSNAIDVFKTFTENASSEQTHSITAVSQALDLNKQNLSIGVDLLNQARLEANNNAQLASQILSNFIANVPDVFNKLTLQDQQNLIQGKITPTILAKVGEVQTIKQQQLALSEQKNEENMALQQAKLDISLARLGLSQQQTNQGDLNNKQLALINTVSDNLRQDANVKEYQIVRGQYQNMTAAAQKKTGVGDIALLRAFARITDPNTGVREEEYRTMAGAIGAVKKLGVQIQKSWWNGEQLTDAGRKAFLQLGTDIYNTRRENYNYAVQPYVNTLNAAGVPLQYVLPENPNVATGGQVDLSDIPWN